MAICKRIWRPQNASGWVQDKSCRLQPSACARVAQSGQGSLKPSPWALGETGKAPQALRPVPMDTAGTVSQTSQK